MTETPQTRTEPNISADERAFFDARYRWCIRQTMLALRDLPVPLEPSELDALYEKARDLVFSKLREQGIDPLTKSELLRVTSQARNLMAVLRKQLEDLSTDSSQVI